MTTATVIGTRTWAIDPTHSTAEFAVRHLMISTVKGRFTDVSGTMSLDEENIGNSRVSVSIGVTSIDTGSKDRDAHLRSGDFFEALKYPAITFESRAVRAKGEGAFEVTGDLTMRGVTKSVALAVTLEGRTRDPWGKDRVAYSARTAVNRKDFGLTWNQLLETGGVAVSDEVKIALDVALVREV